MTSLQKEILPDPFIECLETLENRILSYDVIAPNCSSTGNLYRLYDNDLNNPMIFVAILLTRGFKVRLQDGFELYTVEYLAEREESFLKDIMESFGIKDYRGSVQTSLEFFLLVSVSLTHGQCNYSYTGKNYGEILNEASKLKSNNLDLSEASLLLSVLIRNVYYCYIVYNTTLTDNFSPVDYFRLACYEHFDGYQCSIFSSVEDRKKNIITEKYDLDWKPQPIEKYFLGYERLSKCYVNTVNETIENILISDLCNIAQGYLWDTLEIRASEVGMKFPIQVISDSDKYNYYFTNLSNYNDVLLGPSDRFFQYHNGIKIGHRKNYQYITKSDEELLSMLYKKNIKDITWESRLDLVKQVSVVYGNV